MKRLFLSVFVVFSFLSYSAYLKFGSNNNSTSQAIPSISLGPTPTGLNTQSSGKGTTAAGSSPNPNSTTTLRSGNYKNGTYTGNSADAYYGNVQVQITISNGRISDVQFLDYPHDRGNSIFINSQAMPYLKSEAIQAQSASVDIVSGATATSQAFQESLQSALSQAS